MACRVRRENACHFEISLLNEIYHVIPRELTSELRRKGELRETVLEIVRGY